MRTAIVAVSMCAAWTLALGCDMPEDRAELALLAAEEEDPEIRAELAALAAEDEDAGGVGAIDELSADVDPAAGTCFFCPPPPTTDPSMWVPIIKSPYVQGNGAGNHVLFMAAAGSYIAAGATVRLQVPNSAQTFGPFALAYDQSGTQQKANVNGSFPVGACRVLTVTNPNGLQSSPVSLCR